MDMEPSKKSNKPKKLKADRWPPTTGPGDGLQHTPNQKDIPAARLIIRRTGSPTWSSSLPEYLYGLIIFEECNEPPVCRGDAAGRVANPTDTFSRREGGYLGGRTTTTLHTKGSDGRRPSSPESHDFFSEDNGVPRTLGLSRPTHMDKRYVCWGGEEPRIGDVQQLNNPGVIVPAEVRVRLGAEVPPPPEPRA